jgi:hypothetical protein
MDHQIEIAVRNCHACAGSDKVAVKVKPLLQPIPLPNRPWAKLAIDIMGPFPGGPTQHRFVVVLSDYYTKWPEASLMRTVTTANIRTFLEPIFARFGYPDELITDNGPQFVSDEFEQYLLHRIILHRRSAVFNPSCNGFVERMNRHIKGSLQACLSDGDTWQDAMTKILFQYRNTPHFGTKRTPYSLMFGRECRTRLSAPLFDQRIYKPMSKSRQIESKVRDYQSKYKARYDSQPGVRDYGFLPGDLVRHRLFQQPKGRPTYSSPLRVSAKTGPATYRLDNGQIWNLRNLVPASACSFR